MQQLEQIERLKNEALSAMNSASAPDSLESARVKFLGRKGLLRQIISGLQQLPPDEKRLVGQAANKAKQILERALQEKLQQLSTTDYELSSVPDPTLPPSYFRIGAEHPLSQVTREICDIFTGMGYEVVEGPEIETEYYNFIALNIPPDHPARDDHDSFYLDSNSLLRTETSAVQIRVMEQRKPPIRIISPGRVFRRDAVDATHCHTFHQVEGLYVDQGVRFSDLKGTLLSFVQQMFGGDVKMRFRPDYFPFTEPSAEASISCFLCNQQGCRVCSNTGWLEVLGCGMVHPKVLENVGYDPTQVNGFAFGMGVERIAMLKFNIPDIRLFYENDLRFLRQF